jgi:hypothetical protein
VEAASRSRSRRAELRDAARLSAIPIGVALVFGVLLVPRRSPPDDVPVPIAEGAALARVTAVDHELALAGRRTPLPGPVRALGSAIRDYHTIEAQEDGAPTGRLASARRALDAALAEAATSGPAAVAPLLELRALQLEAFIDGIRTFEATGTQPEDLVALAGRFIPAMRAAGWCDGRRLVPDEPALRTMFKEMWNHLVGFESRPEFAPSLDEERALYALYIGHPHPGAAMHDALEAARRGAHDERSCLALREAERAATEEWRLQHIARLAAIDPTYPAAFASGIASYRRADYRTAASAFRSWLTAHPEGPLALRAQAFLRASEAASMD